MHELARLPKYTALSEPSSPTTYPENVLATVAHHDEEIVMLGQAVTNDIEQGSNVGVLYATRSEASTVNARVWDTDFVSSGGRMREGHKATRRLGVLSKNIHQYDFPDGNLMDPIVLSGLAATIHDIITTRHITKVITTGVHGYDGHPDHIAVHRAVIMAIKAMPEAHQRPITVQHLAAATEVGSLALAVDKRAKIRATVAHFSQFPGWNVLGRSILLPRTKKALAPYASLFERETYWLETGDKIV